MEAIYQPSPWQQRYHALTVDEALGAGSGGPGKTITLIWEPLEQIVTENDRMLLPKNHPHHLDPGQSSGWCLHLRRTRTMLDQTIAKTMKCYPLIDPQAHWDGSRSTWTFSSGYKVQFGHCKDPDDYLAYYSSEFTLLIFDELNQFLEKQYQEIKTRLRTSDPVLMKMLKTRSMSNPVVQHEGQDFTINDPYWVRKHFVDPAPEGNTVIRKRFKMSDGSIRHKTRIYLPARLSDNPNKEFRLNYEHQLRDAPPHVRRALLEGDWYHVANGFYADAWQSELHVCEPFAIPSDWPVFRSMDWGYKAPGCIYWAALDPDDTLFVFREYTFQGKYAREVAARVKEIEEDEGLWKGKRSTISGPADTQLWEARGDSGRSKAEDFSAEGISWVPADKKSRRRNAERFIERLRDHQNGTVAPGIVFFNTCRNALKTIPSMPRDPSDPELPMDGGSDHWHDCILYLCAYVSRRDGWAKRQSDEEDDEDEDERDGRRHKWGRAYGSNL